MSTSSCFERIDQLCDFINKYHDALYNTDDMKEKSDILNLLKGYMEEYLNSVPHSQKFQNPVVERILSQSFFSSCRDYDPRRASNAFESLAKYGQNLLEEPWRKDFETISLLSGYFSHHIHPYIQHPDEILFLMNYAPYDDNTLKLVGTPTSSKLKQVVKDCLLASRECLILNNTLVFIQTVMNRDVLTAAEVYQYRRESVGNCSTIGQKICTNLTKRLHDESVKLRVLSMQQDDAEKQEKKFDENLDLISADDAMTGIQIYDMSPEKEKIIAQEVLKNTQKQFEQQQISHGQGSKLYGATQTDTNSTYSQLLKKKEENLYPHNTFSQSSTCFSNSPSAYFPIQTSSSTTTTKTRESENRTDRENTSLKNTTTSHYSDNIGTNTSFDTHQSALQKQKVSQQDCQGLIMDFDNNSLNIQSTASPNESILEQNTSSSSISSTHNIDSSQEIEKNSLKSETYFAEPSQNKEYHSEIRKKYMNLNFPTTSSSSSRPYQLGDSSTLGRKKSSERSGYFSPPLDLDTTNSAGLYETEYQRQYSQLSSEFSKNQKSNSFNELYEKKRFEQEEEHEGKDKYMKYRNSESNSSTKEKILVATNDTDDAATKDYDFSKEFELGGNADELIYWDCPHCTYRNHNMEKFCEMCTIDKNVDPQVFNNNTSTSTFSKPICSSPKLFLSTQSISNSGDNVLLPNNLYSQEKLYSSAVKGLVSPFSSKDVFENIKNDERMKDLKDNHKDVVDNSGKKMIECPFCTYLNSKVCSFCVCCQKPLH